MYHGKWWRTDSDVIVVESTDPIFWIVCMGEYSVDLMGLGLTRGST